MSNRSAYPFIPGDPETPLEPFGTGDYDQVCERARQAFIQFSLRRLKRRNSTPEAIIIGGLSHIVQIWFASRGNEPTEDARQRLHQLVDFIWLQTESMTGRPQQ